jgi:hypothetical protein
MREQIHKPMLTTEEKVNWDHEEVPDEEVRELIREWEWHTVGRGLFATGSFCVVFLG